jgi:hypothetical protein
MDEARIEFIWRASLAPDCDERASNGRYFPEASQSGPELVFTPSIEHEAFINVVELRSSRKLYFQIGVTQFDIKIPLAHAGQWQATH